jgi:hypothetical protein
LTFLFLGVTQMPAGPEEAKIADELRKMEYEPLLAVEKKLIAWSIGMGVAALAALVWISEVFF